jgi:methyl-accepting chemotaxis protein
VSRLSARAEQFSRQIRANIGAVHVGIKDVERSIERMAALDMGFTLNSKNHLDGIMARVQQSGRDMARAIERQAEITGKVNEVVGSAVTSLQFQDIVGQLVQHTQLRLGSMQEAWRVIGEFAQREPDGKPVPPGEVEAVCGKIAGIFHDADALSLRNPVQQDQMQTGDVDLF